ncbi:type I polyketide synthase, partial [Kitasatospora sp. NPDC059408]|uniref:type I polyketide synthase n=1 Tax=Kitasatospora sp. NPDC059408 TaxID=3346823 RepID=UPI0036A49372
HTLATTGHTHFIETSPHPVLTTPIQDTLDTTNTNATTTHTLRRNHGTTTQFRTALTTLHTHGKTPDWHTLYPTTHHTPLPTYPFQHHPYWLNPTPGGNLDIAGHTPTTHPVLTVSTSLATTGTTLYTGRTGTRQHPWTAQHAVNGTVLVPGTAFVDMALHAAADHGQDVEELTLQTPLVLPDNHPVALQLAVTAPDQDDRRTLTIHSRPTHGDQDQPWTLHATGTLAPADDTAEPVSLDGAWPPLAAEPLPVAGLYEALVDRGYDYGPVFQGLQAAWRSGDQLFAEVALPEETDPAGHAVHPALLDAGLHTLLLAATGRAEGGSGAPQLPFAWSGVRSHGPGGRRLRVRISPAPAEDGANASTLAVTDQDGRPVATIRALVSRPIDTSTVPAPHNRSLFQLDWTPVAAASGQVEALVAVGPEGSRLGSRTGAVLHPDLTALAASLDQGAALPGTVLLDAAPAEDDTVHTMAHRVLAVAQQWLAEERFAGSRLVVVTDGAVSTAPDSAPELVSAPVWGLVRSAQSEHPDRFALLDTDGGELPAHIPDEPQLALRDGTFLVPRLTRVTTEPGAVTLDPEGTVLITGGTGTLGALTARHLLTQYGARHLLLTSRSGPNATGATELAAELTEQGAKVTIAACDTADRDALTELLATIPTEHPLTAVIHTAGVLDDGTITALTPDRLDTVLRPKADTAHHLHELTRHLDLQAFVLYSSASALLGNAGQANYAAANTYLDALAQHRRADGLPATSIAWGHWAQASSMTGHLGQAELDRMARGGMVPLTDEQGLELLDGALRAGQPLIAAARIDTAALGALAGNGLLPPLLRGLVRTPARRAAAGPDSAAELVQRLSRLAKAEQDALLLDLVRRQVAAVLGHAGPDDVDTARAFKELGFDSLTAVQLRNRLTAATGLRLPATLVFDYPTPAVLADELWTRLSPEPVPASVAVLAELDRLEADLATVPAEDEGRERIAARLQELLRAVRRDADRADDSENRLADATAADLFDFIDNDLGVS